MTTLLENHAQALRVRATQCVVNYAALRRSKRATTPSPRETVTVVRRELGDGIALRSLFASVVQSVKIVGCADPARATRLGEAARKV